MVGVAVVGVAAGPDAPVPAGSAGQPLGSRPTVGPAVGPTAPPRVATVRIVFAGSPAAAVPSLRRLLDGPHEVVAVLTRPDAPAGRGRAPRASAVAELARERGLEVLTPTTARDPATHERLTRLAPDVGAVVAYGGLLPDPLLATAAHGWVNLHFSLLPRWRGAAPVQRALLAGDPETGACTFRLVAELDAGPVFDLLRRPLRGDETAGELLEELSASGAALLARTLDTLADGTARGLPQPFDGVTRAPKLTVQDARVDWRATGAVIDRLVRACTPAPGAWTTLRAERVKLGPVRLPAEAVRAVPGAPGVLSEDAGRVCVATGDGSVVLGAVQPAGRRLMAAADWVRGLRLRPAEAFA